MYNLSHKVGIEQRLHKQEMGKNSQWPVDIYKLVNRIDFIYDTSLENTRKY